MDSPTAVPYMFTKAKSKYYDYDDNAAKQKNLGTRIKELPDNGKVVTDAIADLEIGFGKHETGQIYDFEDINSPSTKISDNNKSGLAGSFFRLPQGIFAFGSANEKETMTKREIKEQKNDLMRRFVLFFLLWWLLSFEFVSLLLLCLLLITLFFQCLCIMRGRSIN